MNSIGIVFAGGGGKGAYQIGIWKYLRELGLDRYICAISGTSIGALNGAMLAAGNYEMAERLWLEIRPSQALTTRSITERDILAQLTRTVLFQSLSMYPVLGMKRVVSGLAGSIALAAAERSLFSREGLIALIREGLNFDALRCCSYPCFATCTSVSALEPERFDLREYSDEEMITLLLASSAIPVLFDEVSFHNRGYYDGGLPIIGDNIPIQPVYDLGAQYIIVVHLKQDSLIDYTKFPNAQILELVPSRDLGGIVTGTLDFTSEGSQWRIDLGYEDARHALEPFVNVTKTLWQQRKETEVQIEIARNMQNEFLEIQEAKKQLMEQQRGCGFDERYRKIMEREK